MPFPTTKKKSALQSKGIWGGIFAALAGLVTFFEQIGVETVTALLLAIGLGPEEVQSVALALFGLIAFLGGLVGAYGRYVATEPIDK